MFETAARIKYAFVKLKLYDLLLETLHTLLKVKIKHKKSILV